MSDFTDWLPIIRANPKDWLLTVINSGDTSLALELMQDHPGLLEKRFSGNSTPMLSAACTGNHKLVEALFNKGVKIDFITAIADKRFELVQAMLKDRPSLLKKHSPSGWPALHMAALYSTIEIVNLLISAGARVESASKRLVTPLFFALKEPHDIAGLLLSHGANINAAAKHRFTPLHWAAGSGNLASVRFLIAHGANPNFQTDARQTPWSLSVRQGHRDVTAFLTSLER